MWASGSATADSSLLGLLQKPARLIDYGSVVRVILSNSGCPLTQTELARVLLSRWAMNALRRSTNRVGGRRCTDPLWRLRDLSFDRTMSSRRFKVALRPRLSGITEHPKMDFVDYERRLTSLQAVLQPQLARAHVGRKSHLSAITVRRTWAGPFPSLRRRPNIAPLHLFQIEPRQVRLSRRSAAAEDEGRATQPRPAGDGDACRRPAIRDYVIDVSGVAQELRQAKSRRRLRSLGRRRRNLRVSRDKRKRQNDHDPHAVRSTEASQRQGAMSRLQHHPPAERNSPPGQLHDAALQSYEDLTVFENLDFVAHVYEMAASSGQEPRPASQYQLNAS